jgi:hypothetical protein
MFECLFCINIPDTDRPVNARLKTKCCFHDMTDNRPPHEQGRYELYFSIMKIYPVNNSIKKKDK